MTSIFTIAVGKQIYLDMAAALARSFRLWHGASAIRFHLATDRSRSDLPSDLKSVELITMKPGQYGAGFAPKLYLDLIAPTERSLFIDADCLCVAPLEAAFDSFKGHSVGVIGREISEGEWFGDVRTLCSRFGVRAVPRFNGGVYYLERGALCTQVYETARLLLPQYDSIGFRRLRGQPNDEVIISLAMALHGQTAVPERGDIMNSLLAGPGGVHLDVFKGRALLRNPKRHPRHNPWYEMEEMRPRIVHFLGSEIDTYPYRQEIIRLQRVLQDDWPLWLATLWAKLTFSYPVQLREAMKNILRPLYRLVFGTRTIRASART